MTTYFEKLPFQIESNPEEFKRHIQRLSTSRNEHTIELGMLLLASKEQDYHLRHNKADWSEYVEDVLGMSKTSARRYMSACKVIKDLEINPNDVLKIKMTEFMKFLPLINNGTIKVQEFISSNLPMLITGHSEEQPAPVIDKTIEALKNTKAPSNLRPYTVTAKEEDGEALRSALKLCKESELFKESGDVDLILKAVGLLGDQVTRDTEYKPKFIDAAHYEVLLNSAVPPGMLYIPIIYDKEAFQKAIKHMQSILPDKASDDHSYQIQVRAFMDTILEHLPVMVPEKNNVQIMHKNEAKNVTPATVSLSEDATPSYAHANFEIVPLKNMTEMQTSKNKEKIKVSVVNVEAKEVKPKEVKPKDTKKAPAQPAPKQLEAGEVVVKTEEKSTVKATETEPKKPAAKKPAAKKGKPSLLETPILETYNKMSLAELKAISLTKLSDMKVFKIPGWTTESTTKKWATIKDQAGYGSINQSHIPDEKLKILYGILLTLIDTTKEIADTPDALN